MVEIYLYSFLIVYGILLALFFIFAIINLFHLFAYGFRDLASFIIAFLFIAGAIFVLLLTYYFAAEIDWMQTFII